MREFNLTKITTDIAPAMGTITIQDPTEFTTFDIPVDDTKIYDVGDKVTININKVIEGEKK